MQADFRGCRVTGLQFLQRPGGVLPASRLQEVQRAVELLHQVVQPLRRPVAFSKEIPLGGLHPQVVVDSPE